MKPTHVTLGYVILLFVSGLLVGGTLMNVAEHYWLHAESRNEIDIRQHHQIVVEMSRELNLTPQQQVQVEQILQQTVKAYRTVEDQVEPQFDQVRAEGRSRLRALLSVRQRNAFDEIVRRVDAEYPMNERPPSIPTPCPVPIDSH